ncbi:hypothetical protein ACFS32_23620 [Novosphingobium pokkalii]|uniref:hypothetical protein n=1 Tax=Novosphingobium pokkalii TaxID=1770194 RepID=UPI003643AC2B
MLHDHSSELCTARVASIARHSAPCAARTRAQTGAGRSARAACRARPAAASAWCHDHTTVP